MGPTTELAPGGATVASGTLVADIGEEPDIEDDLLIEEISIDGMCGVY